MKLVFKTLMLFLVANALLLSCVKKEIDLEKLESDTIDPSFAAPLGQVNFNLGRLEKHFVDDLFELNTQTGLLEFVYEKRLFNLKVADIFRVSTLSNGVAFALPPSTLTAYNAAPAGQTVSFSQSETFNLPTVNNEELREVVIKQGSLTLDVSSDFSSQLQIILTIPSLTLGNDTARDTIDFLVPTPSTGSTTLDLSGYTLDFTGGTPSGFNMANARFDVRFTKGVLPANSNDSLNVNATLVIDSIQTARGYFGTFTNILSSDTLKIDFFEQLNGGTVHLVEPKIDLNIFNTSGLSLATSFSSVFSNSVGSSLSGVGLNIPTIPAAFNIGDTAVLNQTIDNTNSNIVQLIDLRPEELIYDATSTTNPAGNNPQWSNFITCESEVWCDSRLVLPLYGSGNFDYLDSNDLDLESLLDIDSANLEYLKTATLRVVADNGLPLNAQVQVYFADTNFVIIDSLFDLAGGENIIAKANVNFTGDSLDVNNGIVTSPTRKITDVIINKTRFINLADNGAKKVIYRAKLITNSAGSQYVKFLPSYNLNLKLSGKVDLSGKL